MRVLGCAFLLLSLKAWGGETINVLERRLETAMSRKMAEPYWLESVYAQALTDLQHACDAPLIAAVPEPAGSELQRILAMVLPFSGRSKVELLFIDCPARMSAMTLGGTIVASRAWLARATTDDLWAVAAHELAHRASDFTRRVVIEHHLRGVGRRGKEQLAAAIETKADAAAVDLLRRAGKDPELLQRFLQRETGLPSRQLVEH